MKNCEDIPACSPGSEFAPWNPLSSSQHRKAPLLQPSQWYLLGCFSPVWWSWGLWVLPQTWSSEIIRQAEGSLHFEAHNSHPPSAQYSLTVHLRCFRSSPLALTLYQRYSHLPRACAQGVQLSQVFAAISQLPFTASVWTNNKHQPLTCGGAKLNALKWSSFWFGFPSLAHLWVPHYLFLIIKLWQY